MFYESDTFKNYIARLNKKIAEWKNPSYSSLIKGVRGLSTFSKGGRGGFKLAIYGAGEHTEMILKNALWEGLEIACIIDRSALRRKNGFHGFKVISPDEIKSPSAPLLQRERDTHPVDRSVAFDAILISSFTYQEEIYSELIAMNLHGIDIIRLYTDDDILKSIKERYAFHDRSEVRSQKIKVRIKNPKPRGTQAKLGSSNLKTHILLIHPPFPISNHRHKKVLPINLLYLSAYIMEKIPDVDIEIMDGQVEDLCMNEMCKRIMKKRWDIIGIGYWTAQAPVAFKLSEFIRNNTNTLLIHGGVHPTICPEDSIYYCDYVVMYEGEETFCEIVKGIKNSSSRSSRLISLNSLNGIAYREKGKVKINPSRDYIEDLDKIPFPKWELAGDMKMYDSPMHVTGGLRLPIIGSRGCPYTCTFCSSPLIWNRRVRWRRPERIVDEMEEAIKRFNINQFHFWDDNLMMKRGHIVNLCNEIIKRRLNVRWCGLTRSSHVNKHKDILPLMKEAGCIGIEIGIESFTEYSTELTRKGEGIEEMAEASRNLEEAGIAPLYTHMLFNPGETITGYYEKQVFLSRVNSKNTAFLADSRLGQASTPHRKTEFERDAETLGEVFIEDPSHCIHQRVNFIPNSLLYDVPVKIKDNRGSPIRFLEVILQAIFDWTEDMIDNYIKTADLVWDRVDGKKTVRELADEIEGLLELSDYHSKMFVSLAIVGLARDGVIRSKDKNYS
jgi:magnesium-protoporphyrin IX monomethyl ester (oxidative) cyclase